MSQPFYPDQDDYLEQLNNLYSLMQQANNLAMLALLGY